MSIISLYEKEKLYNYVTDYLDKLGFKIIFLHPGIINKKGLLVQFECFFYNVDKNINKLNFFKS